jgi:murein DD-endopeptidase MepM/ murein hydrolase activator NlpD
VDKRPLVRISKQTILKWPLATPYPSRYVTQPFGVDWAGKTYCPATVIKKHNGTDYRAAPGNPVYAAYSGYVKAVMDGGAWGKALVLEHTKPDGGKFTTVYWHISPYITVSSWANKGDLIASIGDLGQDSHFHFGVRDGAYDTYLNTNGTVSVFAGTGALPQQNCIDQATQKLYPGFPEKFLNIENNSKYIFR